MLEHFCLDCGRKDTKALWVGTVTKEDGTVMNIKGIVSYDDASDTWDLTELLKGIECASFDGEANCPEGGSIYYYPRYPFDVEEIAVK